MWKTYVLFKHLMKRSATILLQFSNAFFERNLTVLYFLFFIYFICTFFKPFISFFIDLDADKRIFKLENIKSL